MANPSYLGLVAMQGQVLTSQQLASGDNTVLQPATGYTIKIATAVLCNTSGAAVTVSVSLCKTGQTIDGTHRIISGYALAAGGTLSLRDLGLVDAMLGEGDFVSVNASAAAAVNCVITGAVSR